MRPDLTPGAVQNPPAGLIACRVDGAQARIAAIAPRALWLCTPEVIRAGASLSLWFLHPESGEYAAHSIQATQTGSAQRADGAVLTRFFFDDPTCAAAIRRALDRYARYVEIKGDWGAAAYAQALTGYPAEEDEVFLPSLQAQRRAWFRGLSPLPDPGSRELAVALNCPELWELYLEHPLENFMAAYARCRELPAGILPPRAPDRLYVGNPYCRLLFPGADALRAILDKAAREGVQISFITAELRGGEEPSADALMRLAAARDIEWIVNDWGMLERARSHGLRVSLGPQLNRRRKDPRLIWKAGAGAHLELYAENAQNDPAWRAYLRAFGVERYEFERCGYDCAVPSDVPCALHLPFYCTNAALWCPLRAICARGDRGAQSGAKHCAGWCVENALLYPAHLKMAGRWNALLALDDRPWNPAFLNRFDRWVLNF